MLKVTKILLYLISASFVSIGLYTMFDPMGDFAIQKFGVIADPNHVAHGLNTIRGVLGGVITGFGVMLVLGLRQRNKTWIDAVALSMALLLVGRFVGLLSDGFDPLILVGTIGEIVLLLIIFFYRKAEQFRS